MHKKEKHEYISSKEPDEVIMNCLLLLIILWCCSGNNNGNGNNYSLGNCLQDHYYSGNHKEDCGCGRERNLQERYDRERDQNMSCGCNMEREREEPCGCNVERARNEENRRNRENETWNECGSTKNVVNTDKTVCTTPVNARTQYPYIDLEPCTCGCEEKS